MNKKWKRFISSVMAMVMMFSCFVCSSVEVFAADYSQYVDYTLSAGNETATWNFSTKAPTETIELNNNDTMNGIVIQKASSSKFKSGSDAFVTNAGTVILVPVPSGSAGSISMTCSRNDSKRNWAINGSTDSSKQVVLSATGASANFASTDITTVNGITYLSLTANGGEIQTKKIVVTLTTGSYGSTDPDGGPFDCNITVVNNASADATIVVNSNNFTTTKGAETTHTVSLENGSYQITMQAGTEDTYKLTGSDGTENPTLLVSGSGANITVTITDRYFKGTVNITNNSGVAGTIKLQDSDGNDVSGSEQTIGTEMSSLEFTFENLNVGTTYTVLVNNESVGTLTADNAVVSYEIPAPVVETTTQATTQTVTQSTTEAGTETTTQAQTGGFVAVLNAADIAVDDYVNNTCLDTNKYFKVVTSTGSIAVESDSSKTFTPLGGSEIKSVNRISTDGTGSSTKRAIKFKTLTDGKVYVYATSEGSTQRTLTLANSTTDAIKLPKNGDGVAECIFDVTANNEYVLYANNTAYIYYIGSTAELSPYVTYTATLGTYDNTYPVVTLDKTEGLTGTETIKATWSANATYAAGSKSIDLSTLKPNNDNVFVITPVADWFKLLGEVGNIAVYDADGNLINDSYETITAAVDASSTVAGCTIQVKPGTYVEQIKVDKSITIKKADNTTGDVVIYYDTTRSGSFAGPSSMYPVVWVTADYVTLDGLTITNPYNETIGDITANDAILKRAALAVEGNNGNYKNLTLTSVQDTLYINQKSTNVNTFNNCTIKGCTDWICGGGENTFNNCNYVFYSGTGATQKDIGYVFAVGYKGKFTVNGGTLSSELLNAEAANYYYARGWQDTVATKDGDYPELYIYGLDNQLPTTFGESGLLGFYGLTGNKKKDSNGKEVYNDEYDGYLLKCNFWAYAGADNTSELIGTTEPNYLVNLISMNDISEYKFENNHNRLLVADYGDGQTTFTRNSIVDAQTYGFVLFENESDATDENAQAQIEAKNSIESTTLFRTVSTVTGYDNSLNEGLAPGTAVDGKYFGVGVIESADDLTNETVTVIPYIAFDASYNVGGYDYDTDITYCFGAAKTITFK